MVIYSEESVYITSLTFIHMQIFPLNKHYIFQNGDSARVLNDFDEEAQAMQSAHNSSLILDEAYATGVAVLSKYAEQRERLKVCVKMWIFFFSFLFFFFFFLFFFLFFFRLPFSLSERMSFEAVL